MPSPDKEQAFLQALTHLRDKTPLSEEYLSMVTLMDGFMRMANAQDDVPPLVKSALVSFGFVFIHPFMDGNGRISRLLAHHTLHLKGVLPDINGSPAILPLSVAMKKNEKKYLNTLEAFSLQARKLWSVMHLSDNDFVFDFKSSPLIYAHWSGQKAAEFVTTCAAEALHRHSLTRPYTCRTTTKRLRKSTKPTTYRIRRSTC